jgi:hypothetical protein
MTEDELQAIEKRVNAAARKALNPDWHAVHDAEEADNEFLTHAYTDVPLLVAEVRRLRNTLGVARGALADIAHMSELELRDVGARKAERIYDETK